MCVCVACATATSRLANLVLARVFMGIVLDTTLKCGREPGVRNEEILEAHMTDPDPTVLVSPSMSYGVDLKGDLAKFQIIVKAPFLPTKDVRIERMMKNDFDWYQNKMLCSLIQSCGRGVRSKKDECITYILDGTIVNAILKSKHKLPKYFVDRFV